MKINYQTSRWMSKIMVQEQKSVCLVAQENATVAVHKNAKPISDRL